MAESYAMPLSQTINRLADLLFVHELTAGMKLPELNYPAPVAEEGLDLAAAVPDPGDARQLDDEGKASQ